jgi:hypothetical protein
MLVAEFGTGQVFLSMLWFFLFFIWIWILVAVFADVFRSHDLSGWSKALWCVFVIAMPYLGVFVYLIARGRKMGQHAVEDAQYRDDMFRRSVQDAVATTPAATGVEQLEKLASLRAQGVIDEAEFDRMKAQYTTV